MQTLLEPPPTTDFGAILSASERVTWQVEDLLPPNARFDFSRRFLPESLARSAELDFLSVQEQRVLSQIRGHDYLYMFGLVEEFILPFVMDAARGDLGADDVRTRALLGFAGEEAKHIQLFKRFRETFVEGFGHPIDVIGPARDIAAAVLGHQRLAVALTTLHIEWMTQRHYVDSVKAEQDLEPLFASLLRHHWMEEAQHARLDTALVFELAEGLTPREIESAFEDYLGIGGMLDGGLAAQVGFDLDALERSIGRQLTPEQRILAQRSQLQAMRWTFLGSGMTHPRFVATLEALSPALRTRLEAIAPSFC